MSFEFHSKLSDDYFSVLKSEKYSDVIIRVGKGDDSKEYKAHRFVLTIRSKFFEKEIQEKSNHSKNIIVLQHENFDSKAFEYILL